MTGDTNSRVSIQITLDDAGVAQTVNADAAAIEKLGASAQVATSQASAGFQKMGSTASGSLNQLNGHVTSSLDNVRLLSQEFGLRMPRAMEHAISKAPALAGAINGITAGLLGIGALQIFVHLGEEIYDAYEKYVSISAVQDKFYEEMEKRKDEQFINTQSLAETKQHLDEAVASASAFYNLANAQHGSAIPELMQGNFVGGLSDLLGAPQAMGESVKAQQQILALGARQISQAKELHDAQIDSAHALDSTLNRHSQITAKMNQELALAQQEHIERADTANAPAKSFKDPLYDAAKQKIAGEATAQRIALAREESTAIMQARHEEVESSLQGESLYVQKWIDADELIQNKLRSNEISGSVARAQTAAEDDKFFAEQQDRMRQRQQETLKLQQEAQRSQGGEMSRIQGETADKLANTLGTFDVGSAMSGADPEALNQFYEQGLAIMTAGHNAEMDEQRKFTEEITELTTRANDQMLTGYARVNAEEQRMMQQLNSRFRKEYGDNYQTAPGYSAAAGGIHDNADREQQQAHEEMLKQTEQMEAEAAKYSAAGWQGATQQIVAQYQDRLQQENQWLAQQLAATKSNADERLDVEQNYQARVSALRQQALGEMERQAEQERDQMAGALSGLMRDPLSFFKQRGMDYASKALANNVMHWTGGPGSKTGGLVNQFLGVGSKDLSTETGVIDRQGVHMHGSQVQLPGGDAHLQQLASHADSTAAAFDRVTAAATRMTGDGRSTPGVQAPQSGPGQAIPGMDMPGFGTARGAAPGTTYGGTGTAMYGGGATPGLGPSFNPLAQQSSFGAGTAGGASWMAGGATMPGTLTAATTGAPGFDSGPLSHALGTAAGATHSSALGTAGGIVGDAQNLKSMYGTYTSLQQAAQASQNPAGFANPMEAGNTGLFANVQSAGGTGAAAAAATPGMTMAGEGLGAVSGAMTVWSSSQDKSRIGGAMQGAMGGMEAGAMIGMMVGGPVGAALGAGIGLVGGALFGGIMSGGKDKAEHYDHTTVRPELGALMLQYNQGGTDYMSAYSQINDMQEAAANATDAMGSGAQSYYQDTIKKEFRDAQAQLTKEEKAGRSEYGFSAAQYHVGGPIGDFGDLRTGPTEGYVHAMQGEFMANTTATRANPGVLSAMNSGVNVEEALNRLPSSGPSQLGGGGGGDVHVHIHAIDPSGAKQFLDQNKHHIRDVINSSRSEYAGASDYA